MIVDRPSRSEAFPGLGHVGPLNPINTKQAEPLCNLPERIMASFLLMKSHRGGMNMMKLMIELVVAVVREALEAQGGLAFLAVLASVWSSGRMSPQKFQTQTRQDATDCEPAPREERCSEQSTCPECQTVMKFMLGFNFRILRLSFRLQNATDASLLFTYKPCHISAGPRRARTYNLCHHV